MPSIADADAEHPLCAVSRTHLYILPIRSNHWGAILSNPDIHY